MPLTTITDGGTTTLNGRRQSMDSIGSLSCDSLEMDFQDSISEIDHPRPQGQQQDQQGRGGQAQQSSLFAPDDRRSRPRRSTRAGAASSASGGQNRGASSSASVASAASQRENEARIREAKYIIASLRSTVDQLQDALGEATSAADEVEAENAKLRQEVKHLTREREKMIQLVTKVKKIANFLKEDAQQADAEASELRLEVEALKIERDEYKAIAEGKKEQPPSAAAEGGEEEEGVQSEKDAESPAKDTEPAGYAVKTDKAETGSADSDNNWAARSESKSPTTETDKSTTQSRSAGHIKRVGSDGSIPTHRTAESSPSGSKSVYSSNGSIQNGAAIRSIGNGARIGAGTSSGDLVEEDFDEDGDYNSAERRIPAFAPINTVAVRRRGTKSPTSKEKKSTPRCRGSIASVSSRVDTMTMPEVALVQERGRSA